MKRTSKILAVLMALALVMSLAAMSASAVNGGKTSFNKEFAMPSDANVPNVEFVFTITAGTAVPVSADNEIEIKAGIGSPTIEHAVFPSNDAEPAAVAADPSDNTKKIAVDNVEIDFSQINFTEAGVYRYVVTEQESGLPGVTDDQVAVRYLDVFVFPQDTDNNPETPNELAVTSYSLTKDASNFKKQLKSGSTTEYEYVYTDEASQTKSSGYKNELETADLTFSKTIAGNQADMDKRFDFTLDLSNVNPGTYELEIVGDAAAIVGENNSAVTANEGAYSITVGANGTYTGHFYLTNGESVTVKDLNKGFGYEVQEDEQDYTETNDGDPTGTDIQADASEAFTNTREGIIPTGVIITIAPFVVGLLLFGAVIMFMISRRRRVAY